MLLSSLPDLLLQALQSLGCFLIKLTLPHACSHTHTHFAQLYQTHNLAQRNSSTAVKYKWVNGEGQPWHTIAHNQMAVWQEHTTVHTDTHTHKKLASAPRHPNPRTYTSVYDAAHSTLPFLLMFSLCCFSGIWTGRKKKRETK